MTIYDTTWYLKDNGTVGWTAVTPWAASTAYAAGAVRRQLATPTVGNERVFICTVAGTSGGSEPTWILTYGAKTTDNTVTWMEVTGRTAVNNDVTNTLNWTALKNKAVVLGQLMKNVAGTFYFIVTTAGTTGNGAEPTWNTTTGVTTADNTVTWTCIGAVGSFANWSAPFARLQASFTTGFVQAGNTVYISNNHAETQAAAMNIAAPITASSPVTVQCVSDTSSPPTALATGASIATTGANAMTLNTGIGYFYGINLSVSASTLTIGGNSTVTELTMDTCTFTLGATATSITMGVVINLNNNNKYLELRNCNYVFGATSQSLIYAGAVNIIGGTFAGTGSIPTTAILYRGVGQYTIRDLDISSVTGSLVTAQQYPLMLIFENCKINASVSVLAGTFVGIGGGAVKLHNTDSAATNYRYYYTNYSGIAQSETTVVRTGGCSNGVTPLSWKIVTTANTTFVSPFATEEMGLFIRSGTGISRNATLYLTSNSTLNNNDIWVQIEYLGNASNPLGSLGSSRMAWFGTAAALTTDSGSTWAGGITNKYSITLPFTPQMTGTFKAWVYVAKPSATIYIDPAIVIT